MYVCHGEKRSFDCIIARNYFSLSLSPVDNEHDFVCEESNQKHLSMKYVFIGNSRHAYLAGLFLCYFCLLLSMLIEENSRLIFLSKEEEEEEGNCLCLGDIGEINCWANQENYSSMMMMMSKSTC